MHILSVCICRMTLPTNIKNITIGQTKEVHENNYKKKKYTETFCHLNENKTT